MVRIYVSINTKINTLHANDLLCYCFNGLGGQSSFPGARSCIICRSVAGLDVCASEYNAVFHEACICRKNKSTNCYIWAAGSLRNLLFTSILLFKSKHNNQYRNV